MKLKPVTDTIAYAFWCPGCKHTHLFHVYYGTCIWKYDGNRDAPTFEPSLMVNPHSNPDHVPDQPQCHLVLTNGVIHFQSDCTHELAGKSVPMVEFPRDE